MSRVGQKPIEIPQGVEVTITGTHVDVKGPKGTLSLDVHPHVSVKREDNTLNVDVKNPEDKQDRALWGLSARLINNLIVGVHEGFQKQVELIGVGYRVQQSGSKLTFVVGYSHPVEFELPKGVEAAIEKNVVTISGIDKQQVGEVAAQIRKIRKPEPYKGTGIRYVGEVVRRKAGKAAKAVG